MAKALALLPGSFGPTSSGGQISINWRAETDAGVSAMGAQLVDFSLSPSANIANLKQGIVSAYADLGITLAASDIIVWGGVQ